MMFDRFLSWVDSESLRLPQSIIYAMYCLGGMYMILFAGPPVFLYQAMGGWFDTVWAAMMFVAPLVVLVGYKMRNQWFGTWLQLGGDVGITLGTLAYSASLVGTGALVKGTFAFFAFLALTIVSALIALRDTRRLSLIKAVATELDRKEHSGVG